MRKRMLSVVISAVMILSSFTAVFAAGYEYDGIKPLKTAEGLVDQLNTDAGASIFDKTQHEAQLAALKEVNDNFDTLAENADWSAYIDAVYTNRDIAFINDYMKTLAIAEANPTGQIALQLAAVDAQYDTTGDSLKESFAQLQNYKVAMKPVFANNRAELDAYVLTDDQIKEYILMPTKLVYHVIFSELGAGNVDENDMEYNYSTSWLGDDHAKKLYAMLFGEALTRELASDEDDAGVVSAAKEYIQTPAGMSYVRSQLEEVFVENTESNESVKADSVEAMFDFIGNILYNAYEGEEVQTDIQMLFGKTGVDGAFELGMEALDADYAASNVLFNLFLSHYVQTTLSSSKTSLNTINGTTEAVAIVIEDNSSVDFVPENIFEEYEIHSSVQRRLSLIDSWFDLVCFVEDTQNPGNYVESNYVDFINGKIEIEQDSALAKGEQYDAFFVLYRAGNGTAQERFIESYPVKIVNEKKTTPGGGGGTTSYTLTYETNGGTAIDSEKYSKGTTVDLVKVPVKDGYNFAGWYLDKELTKKVDAVVMSNSVTVYAAWTEISGVDVPDMLNGDDHFAYVIGYPDGTVRPQNNITRAEAVTILFRLLKADVREANLTADNEFVDVNEGDWFNTAVSTLAALDIVKGRTETEFMPNEYITRAEFAAIFARFAEFDVDGTNISFTDINNHWAKDEIIEAAAYGWIKGYEDNSFRPNQRITRAEAMTLINRVLKRIPETVDDLHADMFEWSDNMNETVWYYLAVQEATNSHECVKKNNVNEKWTNITEAPDWAKYEK